MNPGTKSKFKKPQLSRLSTFIASLVFSLATTQSAFAQVNLSSVPLFLKESVDPNLMFVFDDSGSMGWEFMPDSVSGELTLFADTNGPIRWSGGRLRVGNFWYYSSRVNTVYYDPNTDYKPPFKPDGSGRHPDSSFSSAWSNGFAQTGSVDLGARYPTTLHL
jgi:type IV pilus assembly protein PilY1